MRRLLISVAISLIIFWSVEFITYLVLGSNFDSASFCVGCFTCMVIYIIAEYTFKTKNRIKNGALANITITVKDANDPDQVANAFSTGLKVFNEFRKLGNRAIEHSEAPENSNEDDGSDEHVDSNKDDSPV